MMSTGRLKVINSRANKNRRFLCVMNDVAKTQQDLYDGYIDQEKGEASQRLQKSIVHTRRNVVRQRVLKECMKTTREEVEQANISDLYGKYHGVPIEHIAGEIDTYLEHNHPRIRREQKVRQLFKDGYESGAILDKDTIDDKVKDYFDRPLVEVHHIAPESLEDSEIKEPVLLPPISSRGFYTGSVYKDRKRKSDRRVSRIGVPGEDNTQTKLFVNRKVRNFLAEHVPDNISLHSIPSHRNNRQPQLRPTTLPAIKPAQADQVTTVPKKAESIGDLVQRVNNESDKQVIQPRQKLLKQRMETSHSGSDDKMAKQTKRNNYVIENDMIRPKPRHERQERKARGSLYKGHDGEVKSLTLPPLKLKNKSQQQNSTDLGITY